MASRKRASDTQAPDDTRSKSKRTKVAGNDAQTDDNGDKYWEISKMRRVTVSEFRGKTMVSVREYYEKDGKELPGKKGISMTLDQFSSLIQLLPDIEQAVKEHGESLPRPAYVGQADAEDSEEQETNKIASPSKQNIEATSDEDSDS